MVLSDSDRIVWPFYGNHKIETSNLPALNPHGRSFNFSFSQIIITSNPYYLTAISVML